MVIICDNLSLTTSSFEEKKLRKKLQKSSNRLRRVNKLLKQKDAELQQLRQSLQEAEQKYRSLFEDSVVGIFQRTSEGYYLSVNSALVNLLGYESSAQLLSTLNDSQKQLYVDSQHRQVIEERLNPPEYTSKEFESQVYRQDGSIIWILENVRAVRDDNGNVLYYQGFVTDITERKLANEECEQPLQRLQQTQSQLIQSEKMSSLGRLVTGVVHEMNNSLNYIFGNLNPAGEYAEDLINLLKLYAKHYPQPVQEIQERVKEIDLNFLIEDFPQLLSSMQVGADRIHQIVQSLSRFSRFDEAQMKPFDLHEGINLTLLILQHRLKPRGEHPGITVIKEYGELPLVTCYGNLLNQVFLNLLNQAIDNLEQVKPDVSPTIRIQTNTEANQQVIVRIIDNGFGIPEERKAQMFQPFSTGKTTDLGLYMSHDIVVEQHGGQLKCLSTPGQGTEFMIKIPIQQE